MMLLLIKFLQKSDDRSSQKIFVVLIQPSHLILKMLFTSFSTMLSTLSDERPGRYNENSISFELVLQTSCQAHDYLIVG